ncbi:MAG: toll/interleukin-1 receptor domain-containing protein [Planctomycetota bacterium]
METEPEETGVPTSEYEVFISYSRKDDEPQAGAETGWVTALHNLIIEDHRKFSTEPLRVFFDQNGEDIKALEDWRHRILKALRQSKVLVVCLSPNYFESEYCWWEWEEFQRRQVHRLSGFENVAPVYFVDMPGTDGHRNEQRLKKWMHDVKRPQITCNLRPWFPDGANALREDTVRQRVAALGTSIWSRVERARRVRKTPGNLPRTNPYFVGRTEEIRQLRENLSLGTIGVVTALHGLGGLGKTDLANAYAHGYADCYPAGLWKLDAEDQSQLLPLIGKLAIDLNLPFSASSAETEADRGRRVLAELERMGRHSVERDRDGGASCLLILDNIDRAELLSTDQLNLLPSAEWLHVLATTRLGKDRLVESRDNTLAMLTIDKLTLEDSLAILCDRQPVRDENGTVIADPTVQQLSEPRRFSSDSEERAAEEIAKELDGFTLAIESVAIYLGLNPEIQPSQFLDRIRIEGLAQIDEVASQSDVANQIRHREKQLAVILDSVSGNLDVDVRTTLQYAALMSPENVVWDWLKPVVASVHPDAFEERPGYPDRWQQIRRQLEGLRLITQTGNPRIGRMHRLVASYFKSDRTTESVRAQTDELLESIGRSAVDELSGDSRGFELLKSLQATVDHFYTEGSTDLNLAGLAGLAGGFELHDGSLVSSANYLTIANQIAENAYAEDPASDDAVRIYGTSARELARFHYMRRSTGDLEQAKSLEQRAASISRKFFFRTGPLKLLRWLGGLPRKLLSVRKFSWARLKERYKHDVHEGACQNAERLLQQAEFERVKTGSNDPSNLLRLVTEALGDSRTALRMQPESERAACLVSLALTTTAFILFEGGEDLDKALEHANESLVLCEKLAESHPENQKMTGNYARTLMCAGLINSQIGGRNSSIAGPQIEEAIRLRKQQYFETPDSVLLAREVCESLSSKAGHLIRSGNQDDQPEIEAVLQECLSISRQCSELNQSSAQSQRDLAVTLDQVGMFYLQRNGDGDAERAFELLKEASGILYRRHVETWPNGEMEEQDYKGVQQHLSRAMETIQTRDY